MDKKKSLHSTIESGILSAVAIVFAIFNLYFPILGAFLNMFWPLPLILLTVRHGLRWSIMSLTVSCLLISILLNPLQSFFLAIGLGFTALSLGWSMQKGHSAVLNMIIGSTASFLSKVLLFQISFWLTGLNPFDLDPEALTRALEAMQHSFNLPEEMIRENQRVGLLLGEMMKLILPAILITASIFDTFINFLVSRLILKRLGTFTPPFPLFREWAFPQHLLLLYGLSLLGLSFTSQDPTSNIYTITANTNVLLSMFVFLQGLAVIWFFIYKKNLPGLFKGLVIAMSFTVNFFSVLVILLGICDFVFDFRIIHPADN